MSLQTAQTASAAGEGETGEASTAFPSSSSDRQQRTQVCAICQISTNSYHLNYGVSSCLSCRAFFRRIVQQKMKTEMKCKGGTGGNCVITPENRKKCKKCRYEACLRVGMRSDAVMSEDQYKVWFRRMLRKQKKDGGGGGGGGKSAPVGWGAGPGARQGSLSPTSVLNGVGGGRMVSSYSSGGESKDCSNDEDGGNSSDGGGSTAGGGRVEERDLDYFLGAMEMMRSQLGSGSESPDSAQHPSLPAATTQHVHQHHNGESSSSLSLPSRGSSISSLEENFNLTRICPGILPEDVEEDLDMPVLTVEDSYVDKKNQATADKFRARWQSLYNDCSRRRDGKGTSSAPESSTTQEEKELNNLEFIRVGRHRWHTACQAARKPIAEFSRSLYNLHRRNQSFTNTLLRSHLDTLASMFSLYSGLFPEFKRLPVGDQTQLLEHNTRLFTQYFLGRYFYAGSGFKQTQWLLLCQVPDFMNDDSYLRFIPITTFNGMLHLFRDSAALARYQEYAKSLSDMVLGVECNCAVALLCLFSTTPQMKLQAREEIEAMQATTYQVAGYGHLKFNCAEPQVLRRILQLCEVMAANFEAGVSWEENSLYEPSSHATEQQQQQQQQEQSHPITLSLNPAPPSSTGHSRLDQMLRLFDDSFDAYPYGEEILEEYVMYSLGVPFSRGFLAKCFPVQADRVRYVLRQSGAQAPAAETEEEEEARVYRACALYLARSECSVGAKEQLDSSLGSFDRDVVKKKFFDKMHAITAGKKVTMVDFAPTNPCLSAPMLEELYSNLEPLYPFARDRLLFRALSLALAFGTAGPERGQRPLLLDSETERALTEAVSDLTPPRLRSEEATGRMEQAVDRVAAFIRFVVRTGLNH